MIIDCFSTPWTPASLKLSIDHHSDTHRQRPSKQTQLSDSTIPIESNSTASSTHNPLPPISHWSTIIIVRAYLLPILAVAYALVAWLQPLQGSSLHNILTVLLAAWLLRELISLFKALSKSRQFSDFAKSNGCVPTTAIPTPFLASIRHKFGLLLHRGDDLLDNVFHNKFQTYGATHALHDAFGIPKVIHTIDPVNLNAILNKSSADWSPSKSRARTMYPLAQEGLLNSEGEAWHKNRKMVMRHIATKRAKDVRHFENDIQLLFTAIGPSDQKTGWTDIVDLLDLFHRLSLDMSTTFLLGTSANSQLTGIRDAKMRAAMQKFDLVPSKSSKVNMTYTSAYETVRNYFSWRSKLGSKFWLADSFQYRKACDTLNAFADDLIQRAIVERREDGSLIDTLVNDISDPIQIRNLVMDLFIAGQNMTGTIAAWIFAQLCANPEIFEQVRAEILEKFGQDGKKVEMTWDNFRACMRMQHVILETLRMYPLLANIGRNAKRDTILPRGGGPDGLSPIAVPKGTAITANIYLMHRLPSSFGPDAWDFVPSRWEGRKMKGTEYAPFGAGPRICVGQQLTLTEISCLIVRILVEFDAVEAAEGQDNLEKGYRVVVAPRNGVKVRLRRVRRDGMGGGETVLGAKGV